MSLLCKNQANGTHYIPDGCIVCPVCTEERSRHALREYQRSPLRQISQGKSALTTRVIDNMRHAQQIGAERTFCNRSLTSHHRRSAAEFADFMKATDRVCKLCQTELNALVAEDASCSA